MFRQVRQRPLERGRGVEGPAVGVAPRFPAGPGRQLVDLLLRATRVGQQP